MLEAQLNRKVDLVSKNGTNINISARSRQKLIISKRDNYLRIDDMIERGEKIISRIGGISYEIDTIAR